MSYLTPGKLEVGYSLTRKRRERGYRREELTRFRTHSVSQGNSHMVSGSIVVLLVNQHTAERGRDGLRVRGGKNLATIVGRKTPGRLLSGSA